MTQYYIFELQEYEDGSFGDIKHIAYDEDPETAKMKAESKYHEVLSAAAVSKLPSHAAVIIASDGFPLMHQRYEHKEKTPVEE